MAPLDAEVVQRKLEHLRELLQMLEAEAGATAAEFLADRRQQLVVERLLHLQVETACDLLQHLLVQEHGQRPQSFADCFLQAGQQGLISSELAIALAPAAGLRNRLVHDYERLDPQRIHAAMGTALTQMAQLLDQLTARMGI